MNPEEYYIGEDERAYVSPTVSRDEQFEFIDTLRDQIGKNNTLISTQTEQLGTDIQPSLGGLTGSEGYFQQRYQTTPVETQVNTLKATAQAKALNDLMTNYAEQAKNRYQQAYRSAQKRTNAGGTGGGDTEDGGFNKSALEDEEDLTALGSATADSSDFVNGGTTLVPDSEGKYGFIKDSSGNITNTNNPNYAQADDGYYYDISGVETPFWMEFTDLEGDRDFWERRWKANQKAQEKYSSTSRASGYGAGGGRGGAW